MSVPCGACGAPIIWCKDQTGRLVPIDEKPSDKGTVVLLSDGRVRILRDDEKWSGERYTAHALRCRMRSHKKKEE